VPTTVLLCDADDNLFPSEQPAFVASTEVTNRFLAAHGVERRFAPDELRRAAAGRNFRMTAVELLVEAGASERLTGEALERWVDEERRAVVAHLAATLRPDRAVLDPLTRLAERFGLAAVSSSATARLSACFTAAGLDALIPPERRFSAEDSLPVPTSKPDPAVYVLAGERLGVRGDGAVAIEDSVAGVRSAVAAGFPVIGNVCFVPDDERAAREAALRAAGAQRVVASWEAIEAAAC